MLNQIYFFVISLLLCYESAVALALAKRAALDSCLQAASVPVDVAKSNDWNVDIAPYNRRLAYTPAAVAVPTTLAHIQDAVRCASQNSVKVNAKSGGHSYASFGLGGENGHLMIELDRMYNVTVDNSTQVATIQMGARLGHVATQLFAQGGRAMSHGTCPGVGIGGHALHGGFGMASHIKGLALDAIVGATVVVANGTALNCSATQNAELFWAIKGAGSSFGVVASVQVATFQAPNQVTWFSASSGYSQATAAAGLQAYGDFVTNTMPAELNMRLSIGSGNSHFEGVYWGNSTGLQNALNPLLKATGGKVSSSGTGGWIDGLKHYANGMTLDQTVPYNFQETIYATSLYTNTLTSDQAESFVNYWYTQGRQTTRNWYIQIDAHGGKNGAIPQVAADATSYAHRNFTFLYQFYDGVFGGSSYPSTGFAFLEGFVGNVTASMQPDEWGRYINYADSQLNRTAAERDYWGNNLPRLQRAKAMYDPDEVFYFPQSVQPAV